MSDLDLVGAAVAGVLAGGLGALVPMLVARIPEPDPEPAPEPVLRPGPAILAPGDDGIEVRKVQARLRQIAWFYGDVTDHYGADTEKAVRGFQAKRGFPVTGEVDERTLGRLVEMSHEPTAAELANAKPDPADGAALDPRCLTGHAICVDKSSSSLRWVVDGKVKLTLDARFGGEGHRTTKPNRPHKFLLTLAEPSAAGAETLGEMVAEQARAHHEAGQRQPR